MKDERLVRVVRGAKTNESPAFSTIPLTLVKMHDLFDVVARDQRDKGYEMLSLDRWRLLEKIVSLYC